MSDAAEENENLKKTADYMTKHFFLSTGICCSYIGNDGELPAESPGCYARCGFCQKVGIVKKQDDCRDAHLYGKLQAERFGGKYIYFCPAGLTFFISPLLFEEKVSGAILGGPLLMCDKNDYLELDIIRKLKPCRADIRFITKKLNEIPQVTPERVNSLSELLYMVSRFSGFYEDGRTAMDKKNESVLQQGEIAEFIKEIKLKQGDSLPAYPLDKESELLSAISDGDKQNAGRLLNEILGHIFFSSGANFEVIRARVLELIVLLSRAALNGGADTDKIFGLNYKYISEINKFNNVDDLCYWLSEIMNKFISNMFKYNEVKHLDVLYKATDYIRRNYMNKITLDGVAAYVYLSPSYFSKIFKEEMKCNFIGYLNRIRVEQSKKLLLSDTVRLVDVAGLAGFEDQSYFSKVFKRFTGVTPKKYRETRGKTKS